MSFYFKKIYILHFLFIILYLWSENCSSSMTDVDEKYYESGGKCFKPNVKPIPKPNQQHIKINQKITDNPLKWDSQRKMYYSEIEIPAHDDNKNSKTSKHLWERASEFCYYIFGLNDKNEVSAN